MAFKRDVALDICVLITMLAYSFLILCSIFESCILTRVRQLGTTCTDQTLLLPTIYIYIVPSPLPFVHPRDSVPSKHL